MKWLEEPKNEAERLLREGLDQARSGRAMKLPTAGCGPRFLKHSKLRSPVFPAGSYSLAPPRSCWSPPAWLPIPRATSLARACHTVRSRGQEDHHLDRASRCERHSGSGR